ncbi:putative EF-hand domain pair protein [Lupinus albus]|uniref:Putative EF-hand domain pair protein n=1 Tax=Lupinus albus TaxID=3870 RepID=A0A6A4Q5M5_LUPAL|nr:putative EF-hand domain pair protein [Lupinus albus]
MSLLSLTELQRIFEKMDMNGDGFVSLEDLNWLLQKIGFNFSLYELESLVEKKSLDFNEFLFFYNSISKKNNGKIISDHDEMMMMMVVVILPRSWRVTLWRLSKCLSWSDCRSMICFYDTNLDGQLDFQEFKNMMLLTIDVNS